MKVNLTCPMWDIQKRTWIFPEDQKNTVQNTVLGCTCGSDKAKSPTHSSWCDKGKVATGTLPKPDVNTPKYTDPDTDLDYLHPHFWHI